MEQRQTKITEGAGLQESRLNTDFIDWLNKWGTPILLVVLVVTVSWVGYRWWEQRQAKLVDEAFSQFEEAVVAGKPDNLVTVAQESRGDASVPQLAYLKAADIYLEAARRGVVPGGDPKKPEDLATTEQTARYLELAEEYFGKALASARGEDRYINQELVARGGLIAVAITRNQPDRAKSLLREVIDAAKAHGFIAIAEWNEERLKTLDTLTVEPTLYPEEQIAAAYAPVPPAPLPPTDISSPVGVPPPQSSSPASGGAPMTGAPMTGEPTPQPVQPAAPPAAEPTPQGPAATPPAGQPQGPPSGPPASEPKKKPE